MTRDPVVIGPEARLGTAIELLRSRKISELPVVDAEHRPVGMLDITDLIGLEPTAATAEPPPILRLPQRQTA